MKRITSTFLLPSVAATVLLMSGCAPIGTFESAKTVKPGFWRAQVRPEVFNSMPESKANVSLGTDVEIRYGVHQNADLGFRIGSSGLVGDAKQRVVSSPQVNVAVNPSFGVVFYKVPETSSVEQSDGASVQANENVTAIDLACPLIIGYQLRMGGPEVVFAPKIIARRINVRETASAGGTITAVSLGRLWVVIGGISAGLRLPLPGGLDLFPEVTIGYPMASTGSNATVSAEGYDISQLMFTAGLGIGFGRDGSKYYNSGETMPF